MAITMVETPTVSRTGGISIRPFVEPSKSNLGLEKYDQVVFDGIFHEEQLACIERNGIKRYITGLNEFAPEINTIADPDVKAAKIKEIRKNVAALERELAANIVDVDDEQFWNKVKLLKPDNDDLWSKITIRCGNQPVFLNPTVDPYDLIKICAIEAGGFSIVAKSFEIARGMASSPKFYLDKYEDTVNLRVKVTQLKNKALAQLTELAETNVSKLLYVAKIIAVNGMDYRKSTPNGIIYEDMDKYINAKGTETVARKAAQTFLDVAKLDMETLKMRAMVKDATYLKLIALKPDGFIYHFASGTLMGRNPSDCVEYLKNPLNEQILMEITKKIEPYWNK